MRYVITSTESGVNPAGKAFTRTTHTIAGYTLEHVVMAETGREQWSVGSVENAPQVRDVSDFMADLPLFGVIWTGGGGEGMTARECAAKIATAADVSDVFNHIVRSR